MGKAASSKRAGKALKEKDLKGIEGKAAKAAASFNVLFERPSQEGLREIGDFDNRRFLKALRDWLASVLAETRSLAAEPSQAARIFEAEGPGADSIDYLNLLAELRQGRSFTELLEGCVFEAVSQTAAAKGGWSSPEAAHRLEHAKALITALETLAPDYLEILESMTKAKGPSRATPEAAANFAKGSALASEARSSVAELERRAVLADPFNAGRAFRHIDGEFIPVALSSIRKVEDFYGYPEAKRKFMDYFSDFAKGKSNLPLLITSLPGLGKTHFTISHALHFEEITLVLPEPCDLERPLEGLIRRLARKKDKRFALFFDDIDARKIDWYYFRTNIGGSFSLPPNITLAIASNYQFPANISSRGCGFMFQMFDEVRCQEMISDFLVSLGMRQPHPELASVIAADYVEEFGQKFFEELSPRTLVRYLARYESDTAKRKRMLDLSKSDVVTRPDSQVFFETNVKLLKALYGDDAINEMRERQMGLK